MRDDEIRARLGAINPWWRAAAAQTDPQAWAQDDRTDRQPGRWVNGDTIGYVRTGKGNEIDFGPIAVPTPAGTAPTTPLEAKWVSRGWRPEALVTENRFGRGVLATKDVTDFAHPAWAVPAPTVALLLG